MNTARIVVLTTADGVGGIAAYLASRSDHTLLPTPTQPPKSSAQSRGPLVAGEPILEPTPVQTDAVAAMAVVPPPVARPTTIQK